MRLGLAENPITIRRSFKRRAFAIRCVIHRILDINSKERLEPRDSSRFQARNQYSPAHSPESGDSSHNLTIANESAQYSIYS